jgi:hypothetical protein
MRRCNRELDAEQLGRIQDYHANSRLDWAIVLGVAARTYQHGTTAAFLDGSPGKQITNFKSERIMDIHWSFDGSKLGLVRGHTDSEVVLLEENKP